MNRKDLPGSTLLRPVRDNLQLDPVPHLDNRLYATIDLRVFYVLGIKLKSRVSTSLLLHWPQKRAIHWCCVLNNPWATPTKTGLDVTISLIKQ